MIDIFLKTEQPPYDKAAVAEVLGLSAEALTARMQKEHLACITKGIFFRLLVESENPLGGMLKRAVACGLPERYTRSCGVCVRSALGGCPRSGRKNRFLLFFRGGPAGLVF